MLKVLAVLRTAFLIFIVAFTIRATPMFIGLPSDINEPYQIAKVSNDRFQRCIWVAISWIALETAIGWWLARRNGDKARLAKLEPDLPKPGSSEPPFAPPR
jgi:hypothetical protein